MFVGRVDPLSSSSFVLVQSQCGFSSSQPIFQGTIWKEAQAILIHYSLRTTYAVSKVVVFPFAVL